MTVAPDGVWVEAALGMECVIAAPERYGNVIRTEVAIETGNTFDEGKPGVSESVKPCRQKQPT